MSTQERAGCFEMSKVCAKEDNGNSDCFFWFDATKDISSWGRPLNIITASSDKPYLLEFHQITCEFLKRGS